MELRILAPAIVTVAAQLFAGPNAKAAQAQAPTPAPLDTVVKQKMDEAGIVGLAAAIVVDGKVVWTKGYGFADKKRGVPFTPDTIINIGSISKTFTGVALMRAVQEGKLSLDEDINAYLPFKVTNPHHPGERITLRQLATHTSGITDRAAVYRETYNFGDGAPEPLGEFLKSYFVPGGKHYAKANFLDAEPGTNREYSNIGAGLAGYVVELVTGKPLNVYAKQHIFGPLKMNDTGWLLSEVDAAKHATLYVSEYGLAIPIPQYSLTVYPDGGVRTSVANLSKLFIALLNDGVHEGNRVLDKRSVDEMLRWQFTESKKPANVELKEINSGIFWASKRDVTLMGYGGTDPGVKTEMLATLTKDVGVIVFTNTSLAGEEMRLFSAISNELWKHARALKSEATAKPSTH